MKILFKNIREVSPNEVLGEDIYSDHVLLVKKGTKLSKSLINLLKRRRFEYIKTLTELSKYQEEFIYGSSEESKINIVKKGTSHGNECDESKAKKIFLDTLSLIGHEHRLGKILNQDKDVKFLINLFVSFHKKYSFMDVLYSLKVWDHYTFIHSFDTFILGTMLAKKHGLTNLETVALGYLFHDIGKITISPELLNKQRKLTRSEFEKIKKHTIKGEAILRSFGQYQIAHLARSHHERLDGSGYPDQLFGRKMTKELKILQIVDVYSALTLKRSYKAEMSAPEAIQILLRDDKLFNSELLLSLIDSLKIYPTDSTVLLSDNSSAKIKEVNHYSPTIPHVKLLDHSETFTLPLDYSITVSKVINYESKSFQKSYSDFLDFIINGNKQASMEEFLYLIDGLHLEEIYIKIFLPTYWKLVKLMKLNNLTQTKFHNAIDVLLMLLDEIEHEIIKSNDYKCKMLFIIGKNPNSKLPVKILFHLLHLEHIFPLMLNSNLSTDELRRFLERNEIDKICLIDLEDKNTHKYELLQMEGVNVYHKSCSNLNVLLTTIKEMKGETLNIFDRLFAFSGSNK